MKQVAFSSIVELTRDFTSSPASSNPVAFGSFDLILILTHVTFPVKLTSLPKVTFIEWVERVVMAFHSSISLTKFVGSTIEEDST